MLHGKLSTPGECLAKMTQFYLEYKLVVYLLVASGALLDIWHLALAGPRPLSSSWHACADHALSVSGSGPRVLVYSTKNRFCPVLTARWSGCNWSLSHLVTGLRVPSNISPPRPPPSLPRPTDGTIPGRRISCKILGKNDTFINNHFTNMWIIHKHYWKSAMSLKWRCLNFIQASIKSAELRSFPVYSIEMSLFLKDWFLQTRISNSIYVHQ